jgi:hypothetical protein
MRCGDELSYVICFEEMPGREEASLRAGHALLESRYRSLWQARVQGERVRCWASLSSEDDALNRDGVEEAA